MYFNKWVQFALSLAIVITGAMAGFRWDTFFDPATSAKIAGVIGFLKLITNAIAPSSSTQVMPNGGALIAQKATKQTTAGNAA